MVASTSMTITTCIETVPLLPATTAVLLRGDHGIGKSQVVRQIAQAIQKNEGLKKFQVVDKRLSQMTEGDMVGLPFKHELQNGSTVTKFAPPDWYMQACNEPCVLFLDELNRATTEIMQAAFQIVLDRELNGHKLHPLTRVFAAVNTSAVYTITEMDPALLDRFWTIDLNPTVDEWLSWARSINPETKRAFVDDVITDWIAANNAFLDPPPNMDPGTVTTSRRSHERLNEALIKNNVIDNPHSHLFYHIAQGYIGTEAAISLRDFSRNHESRITGKEMIDEYDKVKEKLARLGDERLSIAIQRLGDYVVNNLTKLDSNQQANLKAFVGSLRGEHRLACWGRLIDKGVDKMELAMSVHAAIVEHVLDVFGMPFGEAGIGMMPKIPSFLQPKTEDEKKKST